MLTLKGYRLFSKTTKISFKFMSTLSIKSGLSDKYTLSNSQVVIVGTKSYLKTLQLENTLASKLVGIDGSIFKAAIELQEKAKSVPLYLNLAKIISLPNDASRHNSPSNAHTLFNELKAFPIADGTKNLSIVLYSPFEHILAHVSAIARSFPTYSRKTSVKKETTTKLQEIQIEIVVTNGKALAEKDIKFLQDLSEHIRICGQQVDTPCNELHSEAFANEAVTMVENLGVPIQRTLIVGEKLKDEGFGGIYHVGKAAVNQPVFACFSYTPTGATQNIALVGKGIVYDTGGMQIKPAASMVGMKSDMAGAAALLGAFCTLVKAGFKQNLHCLLCIAENSISPVANKPDDIITMLSGKTVEIAHTDAEGRLVLADGVFYAKTKLNANIIIDMATLTGAQAFATGKLHAGILSNSEKWEKKSLAAGRASGDLCHPFVFAPDLHFKDFDSKIADMKNLHSDTSVGPPSSTAGLFIGSHIDFAKDDLSWLHFDIAFPATSATRGTGFGVALISRLLGDYTDVEIAKV